MKPAIKERLVQALRSGEYKQGRYNLRLPRSNSFCCLGVLCDLYSKETGKPWKIMSPAYLDSYAIPPDEVLDWAGLVGEEANKLAGMNDGGATFEAIANSIISESLAEMGDF